METKSWAIIAILAFVVFVYSPYGKDFLGAISVPGYPSIYFIRDDGKECCEEGDIIGGLQGGLPAGSVAGFIIKVDDKITACSWRNLDSDDDIFCVGTSQVTREQIAADPSLVIMRTDPRILPGCWASACDRAVGNYLFTPFALTKGDHVVSGEFHIAGTCGGGHISSFACVVASYTFSGNLHIKGPVTCTDNPGICTSIDQASSCVNGVCVKEIVKTCTELGCPIDYVCESGVCTKTTTTIVEKPTIITCTEKPELCPAPNTCVSGVCKYTETIVQTKLETITVKDEQGKPVDTTITMTSDAGIGTKDYVIYSFGAIIIALIIFVFYKKK